jgi:hypothetical protein
MSRLAAGGWPDREKVGRKSFYKLAPDGQKRFAPAVAHVYNPQPSEWQGLLELLLISNGEVSRAALTEAGFGNPMPGVWVAPSGTAVPSVVAGAIRLEDEPKDLWLKGKCQHRGSGPRLRSKRPKSTTRKHVEPRPPSTNSSGNANPTCARKS